MDDPSTSVVPAVPTGLRWAARILSGLILVFWGFEIIAHFLGDEGHASQVLGASDYAGLTAMGAWLVGLAVAWRWELIGGIVAIVAFGISSALNTKVLAFPFLFVPITAALFLASWWIRRRGRDDMGEGGTAIR